MVRHGVNACYRCRVAKKDCISEEGKAKCSTCSGECSLKPSRESVNHLRRIERVRGAMKAALPWITSEQADQSARAEARRNVEFAMDECARMAVAWGGLEEGGKKVDRGL